MGLPYLPRIGVVFEVNVGMPYMQCLGLELHGKRASASLRPVCKTVSSPVTGGPWSDIITRPSCDSNLAREQTGSRKQAGLRACLPTHPSLPHNKHNTNHQTSNQHDVGSSGSSSTSRGADGPAEALDHHIFWDVTLLRTSRTMLEGKAANRWGIGSTDARG